MERLDQLRPGQTARVAGILPGSPLRRRLQDLGLVAGTRVECVGVSPLGDPAAYLVRGAVVALRASDAAGVALEGPPWD